MRPIITKRYYWQAGCRYCEVYHPSIGGTITAPVSMLEGYNTSTVLEAIIDWLRS